MKISPIKEKSMDFAVRCVNLYKVLSSQRGETVLSKQLLRSGTSIGANVSEGRNAFSEADFSYKLSIALKEADETQYWLELMMRTNLISNEEYESMNADVNELIAMLTASVKTLQQKQRIV